MFVTFHLAFLLFICFLSQFNTSVNQPLEFNIVFDESLQTGLFLSQFNNGAYIPSLQIHHFEIFGKFTSKGYLQVPLIPKSFTILTPHYQECRCVVTPLSFLQRITSRYQRKSKFFNNCEEKKNNCLLKQLSDYLLLILTLAGNVRLNPGPNQRE